MGDWGWWRGRKTGPTELPYRRQLRQPAQSEEKRGKTERVRGQETLNRCVKPSSAFLLGNARSGAAGRQYEDYLGSLCARCVLIRRLPSQLIRSASGSSETSKQVDSWQEFNSGLARDSGLASCSLNEAERASVIFLHQQLFIRHFLFTHRKKKIEKEGGNKRRKTERMA